MHRAHPTCLKHDDPHRTRQRASSCGFTDFHELRVELDKGVHLGEEIWMLHIRDGRKDARRRAIGFDDDVLIEHRGIQSQCAIECLALMVVEIHRDVDGQAEESGPQFGTLFVQNIRIRFQKRAEEISMSKRANHLKAQPKAVRTCSRLDTNFRSIQRWGRSGNLDCAEGGGRWRCNASNRSSPKGTSRRK